MGQALPRRQTEKEHEPEPAELPEQPARRITWDVRPPHRGDSVGPKPGQVLLALFGQRLRRTRTLDRYEVLEDERVDASRSIAPIRFFRRAHDRLASHVEARVHQHRAPGQRVKRFEQTMETRMTRPVDRLHARAEIDV